MSNTSIQGVPAGRLESVRSCMARRARLFRSDVTGGVTVTGPKTAERRVVRTTGGTSVRSFVVALPGNCSARIKRLKSALSNNRGREVKVTETFLRSTRVVLLSRPASGLSSLGRNVVLGSLGRSTRGGAIILMSREMSAVGMTSMICRVRGNEVSWRRRCEEGAFQGKE